MSVRHLQMGCNFQKKNYGKCLVIVGPLTPHVLEGIPMYLQSKVILWYFPYEFYNGPWM
jgi:hypothetical protein